MGIGAYRHLVTLEHPVVVMDPPTWACSLQPAAQVADGLAAFFVRGRFHPGIGLETQFVFEGRTFQVQSVHDLNERHREIQVTAVEVVGRGTTPSGAPVFVPPTITVGPVGATIDAGESVILTVIAVGAVPLFYQWTADGADLPGETYQFLETGPITVTTVYAVRVSNAYGSVLSAPAVVTMTVTYQDTVIADGAVAYWPLDDPGGTVARDLMAGNHGTISGGVTLDQPGIGGAACMVFNGSTGRVDTSSVVSLPAPMTIEAWVNTTGVGYEAILSSRNVTATNGIWFGLGGGLVNVFGAGSLGGTRNVADGQWHHMVFVFSGATLSVVIDTVAEASGASPWRSAIIPFSFGVDPQEAAHWWPGSLQDIAIYPRALSPAEIAAHYALRVP